MTKPDVSTDEHAIGGLDLLFMSATLILGWLVPGLGHMLAGRAAKGVMFLMSLAAAYALGMSLAGQHAITPDDHPFAFVGQLGMGLPTLVVTLRNRGAPAPMLDPDLVPWIDAGVLFTTVAGLLNYLVLLDAFLWVRDGGGNAKATAHHEGPQPSPDTTPEGTPAS